MLNMYNVKRFGCFCGDELDFCPICNVWLLPVDLVYHLFVVYITTEKNYKKKKNAYLVYKNDIDICNL
jgi:hypothetical protein